MCGVASSSQAVTRSPRRALPLRFRVPPRPAIRRRAFITLRRLWSRPLGFGTFAIRSRCPRCGAPFPRCWGVAGPQFPAPPPPAFLGLLALRRAPSSSGLRGERCRALPSAFFSAAPAARLGSRAPVGALRPRLGAPALRADCPVCGRSAACAAVARFGLLAARSSRRSPPRDSVAFRIGRHVVPTENRQTHPTGEPSRRSTDKNTVLVGALERRPPPTPPGRPPLIIAACACANIKKT